MADRPLLITSDPLVLDDLLRIAASAGVELEVAPDAGSARRAWSTAPVVVVGHDVAGACARQRLPRRDAVVLLGADLDDAGVWQLGVEVGAAHVVFLPDAEVWLTALLGDPSSRAGTVVGVVGGRGGAGATTLAAALAVTATRAGLRTLLIDGDPLGGGIDLVFGGEHSDGLRWPDLSSTRGRVTGAALAGALPRMADLSVLSWDRGDTQAVPAEAMETVLDAGRRASDLVVVDLPRHVDDCFGVVAALADVLLLVVPAEVRASAAAARVAARVTGLCADVRLVVRGPAPSRLSGSDVARVLGLPLAGYLRAEPDLAASLDRGEAPGARSGPLASFCAGWLAELLPQRPAERRAA
ncbi:MAG: CpaE-like family protein [Actinobacteria bacterium]|nr:CpaE-like family protein [Actinomycetota bacterium]MCA1721368.1 CpaE-like family protein [Actinomycetota bacterium]